MSETGSDAAITIHTLDDFVQVLNDRFGLGLPATKDLPFGRVFDPVWRLQISEIRLSPRKGTVVLLGQAAPTPPKKKGA